MSVLYDGMYKFPWSREPDIFGKCFGRVPALEPTIRNEAPWFSTLPAKLHASRLANMLYTCSLGSNFRQTHAMYKSLFHSPNANIRRHIFQQQEKFNGIIVMFLISTMQIRKYWSSSNVLNLNRAGSWIENRLDCSLHSSCFITRFRLTRRIAGSFLSMGVFVKGSLSLYHIAVSCCTLLISGRHWFNSLTCNTSLYKTFLEVIPFNSVSTSQYILRLTRLASGFKIVVWCKLLGFRKFSSSLLICGPIYALVYRLVMGWSSCSVVCMWSHLYASVSLSDGSFFFLCRVREIH
jgi:hypothetical protein